MAIIIPSRGRPEAMVEMYEAWHDTAEGYAAPFWIIDNDDPTRPEYESIARDIPGIGFDAMHSHGSMVNALNYGAHVATQGWLKQQHPINFVGFMGDDHRPRTKGWDRIYSAHLRKLVSQRGAGFVYGDDTIQGEALPTQIAMSANVITALGSMCPPQLVHMFVDNYWLTIGRSAGCIEYIPEVIIEHVHPIKTGMWTPGHDRVNGFMESDGATWHQLVSSRQISDDILKLMKLVPSA